MNVLLYLLVPFLVVGIAASFVWLRNREPTSLESGVESFRREMQALSPEAAPEHRRRTDPTEVTADGQAPPTATPRHQRVVPERPATPADADQSRIRPSSPPPRRPPAES